MEIFGINLDKDSRCTHYHGDNDVVALKCNKCQKYYACYKCHDELESHSFVPIAIDEPSPVLCGHCYSKLTFEEYQLGHCITCNHTFNPNCKKHSTIYFKS